MYLKNFNFNSKYNNIYCNNLAINFTRLTHVVNHQFNGKLHKWVGKNLQDEILIVVLQNNILTINYLSSKGHYKGKCSCTCKFMPLKLNQKLHEQLYCTDPLMVHGSNMHLSSVTKQEVAPSNSGKNSGEPSHDPEKLVLKILFVYSPEILRTYNNGLEDLLADNNNLCAIAGGILSNNSDKYVVDVQSVFTYALESIQHGHKVLYPFEVYDILKDYMAGKYPQVDELKQTYAANVVVFMPLVLGKSPYFAQSASIGFTTAREASLILARSLHTETDQLTTSFAPNVLAHEIGHILGCSHPLKGNEQPEEHLMPAYGHHILPNPAGRLSDASNGTVMSYAKNAIWYFSNPNRFSYHAPNENDPCGVAGISEAYKVVEEQLPRLVLSV